MMVAKTRVMLPANDGPYTSDDVQKLVGKTVPITVMGRVNPDAVVEQATPYVDDTGAIVGADVLVRFS